MDKTRDQYETFPYPERNPKDEDKRLIFGSPSHPHEIDHYLFAGKRDWSKPLRVLFAGGGTGDGLIQLAHLLSKAGCPAEITYIDLSTASRSVAEARAKRRKLSGIRFVTGSLLDAALYGPFDYIDCCGVLHHLPEPALGFTALAGALATGGGLGFMVYAPYGRSGVYPMQEAFETLYGHLPPREKLAHAKAVFDKIPEGHVFQTNPHLRDHKASDAGFYDLLLHAQDQPFDVVKLGGVLDASGLELVNFVAPAQYDLTRLVTDVPEGIGRWEKMAIAEKLRGSLKVHVGYASLAGQSENREASARDLSLVPHLDGLRGDPALSSKLAKMVASKGAIRLNTAGGSVDEVISQTCAGLIARIDGRRSMREIAAAARLDPIGFGAQWGAVDRILKEWGKLWYSNFGVK